MGASPLQGTSYAKQFLYNVLSPNAERGVYDIIGYDAASGQSRQVPHLKSNK